MQTSCNFYLYLCLKGNLLCIERDYYVSFPFSFFSNTHEYIIDCEKSNWRFNRARHLYPAVPFLDPFFFSFLLPRISSYSHVFTVSMHDPSIIFRSMYSIPLCRLSWSRYPAKSLWYFIGGGGRNGETWHTRRMLMSHFEYLYGNFSFNDCFLWLVRVSSLAI